jgi:hypothetical protein
MNRYSFSLRTGLVMASAILMLSACNPLGSSPPPPTPTPPPTHTPVPGAWRVTQLGDDLRIAFGVSPDFPQYGSLDLRSGFFRLAYRPDSQLGTSVLLVPALWVQDTPSCRPATPPPAVYCQGTRVNVTTREDFPSLVMHLEGVIAGLAVKTDVTLSRPSMSAISAHVTTIVAGNPPLYPKPGETFKLVMLGSMHVSATQWDSKRAYINKDANGSPSFFDLPDAPSDNEFIGDPGNPISAQTFGLEGGTSSWKSNAPTIEVTFDGAPICTVLGYVTKSSNPNDDNIGYWCATDHVVSSWRYTIRAFAGYS